MSPPAFSRIALSVACAAAPLALGAAAWACGPWFPNRLLVDADGELARVPLASFAEEVRRYVPDRPPGLAARPPAPGTSPPAQTAGADVADLRAALDDLGLAADRRDAIVAAYRTVRDRLRRHAEAVEAWRVDEAVRPGRVEKPRLSNPGIPEGLPPEFEDYLRGAILHHRGIPEGARAAWQAVLDRPEADRRYRSTWAAFMIGKSWLGTDPGKAVEGFRRVRALARQGFADSLGLAVASLGWEARAELDRDRPEAAIALYLEQHAAGDPSALPSLQRAASAVLASEESILRRVAADATARGVVTAFLLARMGRGSPERAPAEARAWLDACEAAGVRDAAGTERLGWAAYQGGDFMGAARWLARAPDGPVSLWIRARLRLRAGEVDAAAADLAAALRRFAEGAPPAGVRFAGDERLSPEHGVRPAHRLQGELAILRLSRDRFIEALDLLLRAQYWLDAAYVAEQVLTADELKAYVDRAWSAGIDGPGARRDYPKILHHEADPVAIALEIRYLLARRLTRLGRGAEARPYYPEELRPVLDDYGKALAAGRDASRPAAARAKALWEAARMTRWRGLELLGTEVEPDWDALGAQYSLGSTAQDRASPKGPSACPMTAAERERVAASLPEPGRRWHYRFRAADLAWEAAQLMEDDTEALADVLCEAGGWIKGRHPQEADRFYKALVLRCGRTERGREAARRRWFPK